MGMRRRKRSRREQQAMFSRMQKPKRIILSLDPAGDDRYLAGSGTYKLETNPDILSEKERRHIIENGTPAGFVVREYQPEGGLKHEASVSSPDELRRYLDKEYPGTFVAGMSRPNKSVYVEQVYRMNNGDVRRMRIDPQKFA